MSSTINVDHLDSSTLQLHMHFHFHDKSSATLVFVRNAKWRPKNPVKNNFSSLLLLRPKIVKISVVDGLLGCSQRIRVTHPWFLLGVAKLKFGTNAFKIVKVSLVDGLLGCSQRLRVTHPWFSLSKSSFILQFPQSPFQLTFFRCCCFDVS